VIRRLLLAGIALALLSNCGRTASSPAGVIAAPGRLASPDGSHTLTVQLATNDTVHFSVADRSGSVVFSGDAGSKAQRWFFFWDRAGNLWVHSSDVGSSVWTRQNGSWSQQMLRPGSPVLATMPDEVNKNLPQSIKTHLGV
jgi:hypothetical protein